MPLPVEHQLVLKAFHLGNQLSQMPDPTHELAKIDAAIAQLEVRSERASEDGLRLLFYLLLKAEILRKRPGVSEVRRQAKSVAKVLSSPAFDSYMEVVEQTEARAKVRDGLGIGHMVRGEVKATKTQIVGKKWIRSEITTDLACAALDVDKRNFTESEIKFIYETLLNDLLRKHGIEFSAPEQV